MNNNHIIAITNRKLCQRPFLEVMEDLSKKNFQSIILREKDLSQKEYEELLEQCIQICGREKLTVHTYIEAARKANISRIHLPFPLFLERYKELEDFEVVGTSIHKVEEGIKAMELGADYVTAGHIFATDCKKGLPPRGLEFLSNVVKEVTIPVYAIGGISEKNIQKVIETGAIGGCIMSGCMR
ncbi:MAG: thiamine phosphate synthase [Anaerostipes sp.]|jgi:thiamine-phosphate pyrophosphorylase|nr:thiamine phosphate synthase [Anaerostipes sp.]